MHRFYRFIAALLGLLSCLGYCAVAIAQTLEPPRKYIGQKFWYEPDHEQYVITKFHRVPDFDKGIFHIPKKTRFLILGARQGWFQLRLEGPLTSDPIAFIPMFILRARLYAPSVIESPQESFRKASIFEEDPDIVRKRLELAVKPPPKPVVPPPWKIRNRGFPPPGSQLPGSLPPEVPAAESPKPQ